MQNYDEMLKKQQQDYQRSRDPFEYGRQVAQRRYSEIMSNINTQRQAVQQSYGDLYQQARQRAVAGAAAGGPTLSGGMGQQQRDYISALEMQELGRIGAARETATRDLYTQGQAAFSNAQLEGQQATQMELQNQQTQLQLVQQRQAILADTKLSAEQKAQQLEALGQSPEGVAEKQRTWDQWLTTGALTVGGGTAVTAGLVKFGVGLASAAGTLAKVGAATLFPQMITTASGAVISAGTFKGAIAALGGLKAAGLSGVVAAGFATNPVGWTIGAVVVGALVIGAIAGAIRNAS